MDHEADAYRTDLMTITRFVLNEQSKYPESRGDFTILLSNIVLGCKFVCSAVNKVYHFRLSLLSFDDDLEPTLDVSIDQSLLTLFGLQAGLAKLIGLAGETNIQAGFMSLSNLNLSFFLLCLRFYNCVVIIG